MYPSFDLTKELFMPQYDHTCKKCKKNCDSKSYDKDTYKRMGRCYHCQMHFEEDLKFMKIGKWGNKWQFWVKLQQLRRWESIDREVEQFVFNGSLKMCSSR